ncbi:VWA domain-containing protein [Saccharothrix sp. 6-C]|uniref:Mg-chelatase subunit ChlD n=1 Tax=Saccharothrix texasensis TaxID=103734 RepID=A0A3N1H4L6_9PSEU|nr:MULTISPECIES: VWA domain-containing protein [Saccharothrix]QQQ78201.1 VWA domain-containing protein [Saccharothrix sp. 6-C]ROP37162.1 Mg-chelatase subunit ChlD [Saccharothrix texasensis]
MTDLERWRLILGEPAARRTGGLRDEDARRDAALQWLYGRDPDLADRGVRQGGSGDAVLRTVDWLDEVHSLFPRETIERLERDAVERYEITDVVTDPEVLRRIEPNPALLRAVLRTKHLMNPAVLAMARKIVEAVVEQLVAKLRTEVRTAFSGARSRRPSIHRNSRNFDFRATIRANLRRYQPAERKLAIEHPKFVSRAKRHLEPWQVVLLVDQSGSMTSSVIHSAVTAACLWGLPGIKTHLVAFDTDVVDLTSDVTDPVELLMKVQLGGGTHIAKAVAYGAGLVDSPRRSIVVLISDFYEGGSESDLVRAVKGLCEQGTHVLCLAALDDEANPAYDRALAQRLANVGAHVGAMTPGQLAEFVAEKLG